MALAASIKCSAALISGRCDNRSDGKPTGTSGILIKLVRSLLGSKSAETDLPTITEKSNVSYLGTAGDEESDADMKLLGGFVDSREYSTTDLEVAFT